MGNVLALLQAAAVLEPLVMQALPAVNALLSGNTPTADQLAALEAAITALEARAAEAESAG
jgi:hypothetical protein